MEKHDMSKEEWEKYVDHYKDVLIGMDACLYHLQEVLRHHENCAGCDLCIDCQGMEYTLRTYFSAFECSAPGEAIKRFEAELRIDDGEISDEMRAFLDLSRPLTEEETDKLRQEIEERKNRKNGVNEPVPDSPVTVSELPPSPSRPYWLAAE